MLLEFEQYCIEPIHQKHAWRLCDFITVTSERLKRFFPKTLAQNLTPDLSKYFVQKKVKQFKAQEEFLFVLKEKENHSIIGLFFLKELDWQRKEGELAYCIGYQYEGNGYMTEVVDTMSKWAFDELALETLRIIAHKTNASSVRVAEKCGYLWKRTLPKEHTPPNEMPLDMELDELNK